MDFLDSVLKIGRVLMFACVLIAGNELFVLEGNATVALGCLIVAAQLLLVTQFYQYSGLRYLSVGLGGFAAFLLWQAPYLYLLGLVAAVLAFLTGAHLVGNMIRRYGDGED